MQMAVFLVNCCKFSGCGQTFSTLAELIQHIEDNHIDTDPRILEKQELQQPSSLALSYVLRIFTEGTRKELSELQKKKAQAQSPALSVRSSTPTGSEFDEEEIVSDDEDSDDSWTAQEEFTSELILSSMMATRDGDVEKPFACPIPGCKKRYKNVNGIKYHARHGHRKDQRVKKPYKCRCGKSYKTSQGLKSHNLAYHPPSQDMLQQQSQTSLLIQQASPTPSKLGLSARTTPIQLVTLPQTSVQQSLLSSNQSSENSVTVMHSASFSQVFNAPSVTQLVQ